MMSAEELRTLPAKEINGFFSELEGAELLGYVMREWGDEQYWKLADGSYAFVWKSIGD
jgi:hypothetical protein